ncbi:MAG: tandem-95 repeat protein [Trichocoleus desertorum ATA4-8-CV12]|jgi:VCBS repeat-containing protein|nr:tandem-95 repeat protein [Trichocoleus desertorum ATA4-8-CV12]
MSLNFADLFDETYYLETNPDVAQAIASGVFTSGLAHFTQLGRLENRQPSAFFDTNYYLSTNPDIAQAIAAGIIPSAIDHFVESGQQEGREPILSFDSSYYLAQNPDVAQAVAIGVFSGAYEHFLRFGQQERRNPLALFDSNYYLAQYGDVAAAVAAGSFKSAFQHFVLFGETENRRPSADFDGQAYLARYGDVAAVVAAGSLKSAFQHFVLFGQTENRLGVNTVPVVSNQAVTTNEDGAVTINGLLNASDSNGDAIAIASVDQPANGTVTINDDGTLSYTPNLNFNGSESFTYTVADPYGGTAIATVDVLVNPLPDPPIATNDSISATEDLPLTIGRDLLLGNDIEPDGQDLMIIGFTQPTNGSVEGNGDGTYRYIPNAHFNGTDSFTYTITDGLDGSASATVTIAVEAVNDIAIARADAFTTDEDTSLSFAEASLLANDTDVEDGLPTILSFTQPTSGSLARDDDGTYLYTPDPNFNGSDSFTYTVTDSNGGTAVASVTLLVNSINDLPIVSSNIATTVEDTPLVLNAADLLANDSDVEGSLLINNFTQPENGSLSVNGNGTYLYTPDPNFNGSDSFTYTVTDSSGGTAVATVTLTVAPGNDLPIANNNSFSLNEDGTLTITADDLLSNDTDVDGNSLLITNFTPTQNGRLVDQGANTYVYTPDPNFNGTDFFTYTITDGTSNNATAVAVVTLTINSINDVPIVGNDAFTTNEDTVLTLSVANLLTNDVDMDGEPVTIISFDQPTNGNVMGFGNGTYLYMPDRDFSGSDTFTYTVRDGVGATASATVNLTVIRDTNIPPVAANDVITTDEDTAIASFNVLANDLDAENIPLTLVSVTAPSQGNVTFTEEGLITYTPNLDFNGDDSFTYIVRDENQATATATVQIAVNAVNDAPVLTTSLLPQLRAIAVDDLNSPGNMVFDLLGSRVTDADESAVVGIAITQADSANGTWQYSLDSGNNWIGLSEVSEESAQLLAGNQLIRFRPELGFEGVVSFAYHAWDQTEGQDGATLDLTTIGTGGSTAFSSGTETAMLPVVMGGILLPGTMPGI